jgi:hypothetical protein
MGLSRSTRWLSFVFAMLAFPTAAFAQIDISITVAPPVLPVYEQPVCPDDGYLWTPGYWAYAAGDYYWVPGAWVMAPDAGLLWTPPYWGWGSGGYLFHEGYWASQVGFYGGIFYGYGYSGVGFEGGRWDNGHFFYNRSVANVNVVNIHNVYNKTVINNSAPNRVSYNGGAGGTSARPTHEEEAVARVRHVPPVAVQAQHAQAARSSPNAATSAYRAQPKGTSGVARPVAAVHPNDLPPMEHAAAPNSGDPKLDKKYQQQQEKLSTAQSQERQKLQQQHDQDHRQLALKKADPATTQQTEQRHQQETAQLQQKHAQQQETLKTQQPASRAKAKEPPKEKS